MKRDSSDKAFQAFVDKAPSAERPPHAPPAGDLDDPLIHELVLACLTWNAPRAGVAAALDRIRETLIDYNEFRVMIPKEAGALLGARYPLAEERCARTRAALTEVFLRENGLALAHLREANKRDAKAYLESLPGLPAYAVNRVALVGCGVHAFPVDSVIHDHFDHAGVIDEDSTPDALCARLERAVRAADTETRFWAIESAAAKPKRKSSAGSKKSTKKSGAGASKKTAKKSSGRTSKASSKKTTRKKTGKSA
jgi:endonuclease III